VTNGLRVSALLALLLASRSAEASPDHGWEVSALAQAGWAGEVDGFGAIVHGLWVPNDYVAVGAVVDTVYLSGGGDRAGNGRPYSASLLSTYLGGIGQLRVAVGPVMPFLELGLGGVLVTNQESVNNQCRALGGLSPSAATGVNVFLTDHLGLGLRAGARFSSSEVWCTLLGGGPASLGPDGILLSASAGLNFRW